MKSYTEPLGKKGDVPIIRVGFHTVIEKPIKVMIILLTLVPLVIFICGTICRFEIPLFDPPLCD